MANLSSFYSFFLGTTRGMGKTPLAQIRAADQNWLEPDSANLYSYLQR